MPAEYVWQPNFGLPWLRAEGVRGIPAAARAALEQFESGVSPDLVLTDLTMPGMNGIELASEIRRRGHSTPIVCCTGFVEESTERAGLAAGMRAFVRKPVDWDHLRNVLNDALASSGSRAR
jgi:two-component system capsular synthesis sensor histidine kinase RcsC